MEMARARPRHDLFTVSLSDVLSRFASHMCLFQDRGLVLSATNVERVVTIFV